MYDGGGGRNQGDRNDNGEKTVLEFAGKGHKTHDYNINCENDDHGDEQAASKDS